MGYKNPRLQRDTHNQIRFSINVWCSILNTTIIGPYFFIDNLLNSERYLHFLQFVLPDFIHELFLQTRQNLRYFQQDGAPAHNTRIV